MVQAEQSVMPRKTQNNSVEVRLMEDKEFQRKVDEVFTAPDVNAVDKHYNGGKLTEGVCYPVQAEVGNSGGYSWVRIFVAGVQRYAAVLADRCRLVTLSPGDAFAACVAQGGDAAGQRAQRDGRQAGAYAQRTEASGTAPGV